MQTDTHIHIFDLPNGTGFYNLLKEYLDPSISFEMFALFSKDFKESKVYKIVFKRKNPFDGKEYFLHHELHYKMMVHREHLVSVVQVMAYIVFMEFEKEFMAHSARKDEA